MKKSLFVALSLLCFSSTVTAKPFASFLRIGTTDVNPASGTVFTYVLNEAADSVTIEVVNSSNSVVATFAGTGNVGDNTVNWNGTVDNASGAPIPVGAYTFRVKADKNVPGTAWYQVGAVTTGFAPLGLTTAPNLFSGMSPMDLISINDQKSDHFGTGIAILSYIITPSTTPYRTASGLHLRSDFKLVNPDAVASAGKDHRIFISEFETDTSHAIIDSTLWHGSVDPENSNIIYIAGQTGDIKKQTSIGDLTNPATLDSNVNSEGYTGFGSPRAVVVRKEGANKYAYYAFGNSTIAKAPMDPATNKITGNGVNILSTPTSRYMRVIDFDADGNLYMLNRGAGSNHYGGTLFRWNADTVANVVLTGNSETPVENPLTEDNASWKITITGTANSSQVIQGLHGISISPDGDVCILSAPTNSITAAVGNRGIYFVGNTSSPTLVKALTTSDRVVNTQSTGDPATAWDLHNLYATIRSDAGGNVVVIDRRREQIRSYSKPGFSSNTVSAPTSQAFTVNVNAKVEDWKVY